MGTSDEQNSKAIDASVGVLVWVQRRNKSWWPGQIMADQEVPHTSSPKSGTPIKLLGRDDASVDWYDLEKSKRVKAFRCGEYDTCIEAAKAMVSGTTSKKAIQYARRQDAIVQALEIESAHLAKDHSELPSEKDDKVSESVKILRRGRSSKINEALTDAAKTGEAVNASKVQPLSELSRRTSNESEDEGTEGNKRMRGLEDIEMGIGSKGTGTLLEANQEIGVKSDVNSMPNGTLADGRRKECSPPMKRRKPPVIHAVYTKRKNRRRPLTEVLESIATLAGPVICAGSDCSPVPGLSESKVSAVINKKSSESNGVSTAVSLNASENVVEAIHNKAKESETSSISVLATDDSSKGLFHAQPTREGKKSAVPDISTAALTSSLPRKEIVCGLRSRRGQIGHNDVVRNGGSKGSTDTSPAATLTNGIVCGLRSRRGQNGHNDVVKNGGSNGPTDTGPVATLTDGLEGSISKWPVKGKRKSRKMTREQVERRNAYAEEANNNSPTHRYQKRNGHFSIFSGRKSQLREVEIEVDTNYKRPLNVPLISLMSNLNGKAVIGHPLLVEALEDGSYDRIITRNRIKPLAVPMVDDDAKPKKKSKKSSSVSIKTRWLSALSGKQLKGSSMKKLKREKAKQQQIVSCIPLKVVFSRISEAVKGSGRQVHKASLPSAAST